MHSTHTGTPGRPCHRCGHRCRRRCNQAKMHAHSACDRPRDCVRKRTRDYDPFHPQPRFLPDPIPLQPDPSPNPLSPTRFVPTGRTPRRFTNSTTSFVAQLPKYKNVYQCGAVPVGTNRIGDETVLESDRVTLETDRVGDESGRRRNRVSTGQGAAPRAACVPPV